MEDNLLFIESLDTKDTISESDLSLLFRLSDDADEEVRYRSIQFLGTLDSTKAILGVVRRGLSDEDELVRVECAEILGSYPDCYTIEDLVPLLSDESTLVRSAALVSMGQQGNREVLDTIKSSIHNFNRYERVSAFAALYMLGEDNYFIELLKGLSDDDYIIRCATANLLALSIKPFHAKEAAGAIENAMIKENSRAVLDTFRRVLSDINERKK